MNSPKQSQLYATRSKQWFSLRDAYKETGSVFGAAKKAGCGLPTATQLINKGDPSLGIPAIKDVIKDADTRAGEALNTKQVNELVHNNVTTIAIQLNKLMYEFQQVVYVPTGEKLPDGRTLIDTMELKRMTDAQTTLLNLLNSFDALNKSSPTSPLALDDVEAPRNVSEEIDLFLTRFGPAVLDVIESGRSGEFVTSVLAARKINDEEVESGGSSKGHGPIRKRARAAATGT